MPNGKPYILFCAGEDSGDNIGESLVREVKACSLPIDVVGAGGLRMQEAGLQPLVDYEALPVSGFGDVFPRYPKLRRSFLVLETALKDSSCLGFVAIDYPGFNMKLIRLADSLGKPSLYVAPPQVWAWKARRASQLARMSKAKFAVFFDFEKLAYERAGCEIDVLRHPFVEQSTFVCQDCSNNMGPENILLFPGSRESQMKRNVPIFLKIAEQIPNGVVSLMAARLNLIPKIRKTVENLFGGKIPQWVHIEASPQSAQDRCRRYGCASAAIAAPGTSTLELALSGVPLVVCTKPDALTYMLGRKFVKTSRFALPNIILGEDEIPEFIKWHWNSADFIKTASFLKQKMKKDSANQSQNLKERLQKKLFAGQESKELMSKFLAQFV